MGALQPEVELEPQSENVKPTTGRKSTPVSEKRSGSGNVIARGDEREIANGRGKGNASVGNE